MKITFVITVAICSLAAVISIPAKNPLSDDYIDTINKKQSLWKAGRNFHPDTPLSELQALLGLRQGSLEGVETIHHVKDTDIPETFDSRENWFYCGSTKRIYDQSNCGSCWAVSTASAMSDRLCIHSNMKKQLLVSARNLMSCCTKCGDGCQGGWPIDSWKYWISPGLVTGGAYNTSDGCQNYPFPQCEHHGTNGTRPPCGDLTDTPKCVASCDQGTNLPYESSFTYGESAYMVEGTEEQIQLEILKNGPVIADYTIYNDFFSYKSGVYTNTTDEEAGRHAVRVLGWGVENDVKYWLIANSWNTDWGDNGLFKILRGQNECGIEEEVSAGIPQA